MENDETRDLFIEGLTTRIIALQQGGFDIYKEYIQMLSDPRRTIDPITKEIQTRILDLLEEVIF